MMSSIRTGAGVAVLNTLHGLHIDCYANELDAVLDLLNNGRIGRPAVGWGSDGHKQALQKAAAHIQQVQAAIAEQDRREAAGERQEAPQ